MDSHSPLIHLFALTLHTALQSHSQRGEESAVDVDIWGCHPLTLCETQAISHPQNPHRPDSALSSFPITFVKPFVSLLHSNLPVILLYQPFHHTPNPFSFQYHQETHSIHSCLLYTSDAADERS